MTKKIVTLGEVLLRLSPPNNKKLINSNVFEINYGGAELNVAANLSILGLNSLAITKIPNNEIGDSAIAHLKNYGVDTTFIKRGGERIGTYFLENGYSIRNSQVIYDRKNSSFSNSISSEYDIENILKSADLFHVSGITLAISPSAFDIAQVFMKKAKEMNITVSFDFNYRSKLWSLDEASSKIKKVLPYVDIAFAGYLDFINILEIPQKTKELDIYKAYEELYPKVIEKYNFKYIVSSIRKTISSSKNIYRGIMFNRKELTVSKEYNLDIIDRVGSGDAFASGFLYSYLLGEKDKYKIEFATSSAIIKHTIHGDINITNKKEIESLFSNDNFDVLR